MKDIINKMLILFFIIGFTGLATIAVPNRAQAQFKEILKEAIHILHLAHRVTSNKVPKDSTFKPYKDSMNLFVKKRLPKDSEKLQMNLNKIIIVEKSHSNTFNPLMTYTYLYNNTIINLKVYNNLYNLFVNQTETVNEAGFKSFNLNTSSLVSGIYVYYFEAARVSTPKQPYLIQIKKVLLLE